MIYSDKNPKSHRATIYDVAKNAGVSPSTVSHVLNGTASISDVTKDKVWQAVETLNYYPNVTARSLRQKRSNIIGLIIQDMTSEFYSIMYEQMLIRAQQAGYLLLILCGCWDTQINSQNINSLIENQAEGIIAMGSCLDPADLERAKSHGITVVLCDQYSPSYPNVEYNNYATVRKLVHCFVAEDKKRIAYVHTNIHRQDSADQRFRGYMQGMRDEGLDSEQYVISLDHKESKYFKFDKRFDRFIQYLDNTPRQQ